MLANGILHFTGGDRPYLLLAGFFIVTAVMDQLISNTATALTVTPIALSVTVEAGSSPFAVPLCVSVASASALPRPIPNPGQHGDHGSCRLQIRQLRSTPPPRIASSVALLMGL